MSPITENLWPEIIFKLREAVADPADLFLVGGIVRDVLKRRPVHDVDLVTSGGGQTAARRIANAFSGAFYPIDPTRDTGRAIVNFNGKTIYVDIAHFRGDSLEDDLRCREFTVNAMAVSLADLTTLIDPLGGFADLFQHKVLRLPAPDSIESNPIRALRAVRHALTFGLRILPETKAAIRLGAPLLIRSDGRLHQPERCRDEFFKLLSLDLPIESALMVYHTLGLLAILPAPPDDLSRAIKKTGWLQKLLKLISARRNDNDASNLRLAVAVMILDRNRVALRDHFQRTYGEGRTRHTLLFLQALTAPSQAARWKDHFHLTREEDRVLRCIEKPNAFALLNSDHISDRECHLYFRDMGDAGVDGVLSALSEALLAEDLAFDPIKWGDLMEHSAAPLLDAYYQRHAQVIAPHPLLDGHTIKKICPGIAGQTIGDLSLALVEEQAAGEVRSRSQAVAFIKGRFKAET